MTKLFTPARVRLLVLGGAKAHTNGDVEGNRLEEDHITPRQA